MSKKMEQLDTEHQEKQPVIVNHGFITTAKTR